MMMMMRRRTTSFVFRSAATVAAIVIVFIVLSNISNGDVVVSAQQILSLSKVKQLHSEIRAGDNRLIRLDVTDETAKAQVDVCPFMISSLVDTVHRANELSLRGEAAEVLALCTTSSPANRADIGEVMNGNIYNALDDVLVQSINVWNSTRHMDKDQEQKDQQRAIREETGKILAQVAETIWILSFHNEKNVEGFYKAGIVDHLVTTIKECPVMFDRDFHCSEAVMWSLAALANMAASYCTTEDGICDWERDNRGGLKLPDGVRQKSKIDVDVRDRIMYHIKNTENFFRLINYLVDGGPVNSPHDDGYSWPSKGKDIHSEEHPEIVPWAAAALVRNLALSSVAQEFFWKRTEEHSKLFVALCNMYKKSPDELEEDMSFGALYRMNWEQSCPSTHARCTDIEGWSDNTTGKTCRHYESEKLCASMGDNTGTGKDSDVTADEACCICGGGIPKHPEQIEAEQQELEEEDATEF